MGIVRWNEDEKKAVEEIRDVWEIRDLDSEKIVTKRSRAMYRRFAYREMQKRKDKIRYKKRYL